MPRPVRLRNTRRFGPVRVGTYLDPRGTAVHVARCTTPRCPFTAQSPSRAVAELAARRHHCTPR